ncbi:hypothetical protein PMAYCL1PPCAC_24853, partial [Pristionchus mayeri]
AKKKSRLNELKDSIKTAGDDFHSGFIRFDVEQISTLDEKNRWSHKIEVQEVMWGLSVRKFANSNEVNLLSVGFFTPYNKSSLWSIDVTMEFILVHPDSKKNAIAKDTVKFNRRLNCHGLGVLPWNDVMNEDKGFIKDDKITVEGRFTITSMKGFRTAPLVNFGDSDEPCHDVVLIIEGEKIHVNKGYLSIHSSVFKAMFFGEFAE